MNRRLYIIPLTVLVVALLVGCSTTSGIPDGDQLYTGMKKTQYNAPEKSAHYDKVVEELDAALATAPNGSLFGSSTFRNPLQVGLWIWNAFANDSNAVSRWLVKSFGSRPVLMSRVNPALRASVAKEVLRQHGYMRGTVTYNVIPQRNPKKAKIAYTVNMGHLFTIDTLKYFGFPASADSLMEAHKDEALITSGSAFDVSTLDGERQRLSTLFRNNGYYYYQPSYASYVADTFSVAGKVQLHLQVADNLPPEVGRKWYIGNVDLQFRRTVMEPLTDSIQRYNRRTGKARPYIFRFNGKRMPISPRVVMSEMRFRPGQLYNYANYQETANLFSSTGLFSMVDFKFTPRDTTATCDTLDVAVNCVFQKPYDFYISANLTGKSNNYFGPGAEIGLTKRNAFRGGETLDLSAYGSYEWQTGHNADGSSGHLNSYEYGFSASVEFPRLVMPWAPRFRRHRRNYATPSTTLKISSDVVNRAKYFKRHIVSAKWMYTYQPTATVRHQFSPLTLSYEYTVNSSATYDSIVAANPYLLMTMQDQFIPKMQYFFSYSSPASYVNPIRLQVTASEAGNILSLGYLAAGKGWNTKDKTLLKNPYAQFLKLEANLVKTWSLSAHTSLVGHVNVGAVWTYGNSEEAPYSEQFYVGGANSIRAFSIRGVGPGSYSNAGSADVYNLGRTGDLKFVANLEYRPRLFGNLYGAVFLDAGNVWRMRDDGREGAKFEFKNVLKEMALGTGVGLRYDLNFFMIRVDWGIGLHLPYKPGFYNFDNFKDSQSLHFAIGLPF